MKERFIVRDREAGNYIDGFDTVEQAKRGGLGL